MVDFKKSMKIALGVTGISWGLSYVYQKFFPAGILDFSLKFSALPVQVQSDVGAQVASGIDPSIGGKILAALGNPSIGMATQLVTLYLAALVVVIAGTYLFDYIGFGKSETTKFAVSMSLGAGLVGLLLGTVSPKIGSVGLGLAMLVYFGIVATAYKFAGDYVGRDIFPTA